MKAFRPTVPGYHKTDMVIRRRTGWAGQIAPRALLAVLCVVGLLASGCTSDDGLEAGEAATVAEGSTVEYALDGDGDGWTELDAGGVIPTGAQVRTGNDEARLTFRDGAVRLAARTAATLTAKRVTLERGAALVASTGGLSAATEDTTITGEATYRVDTGLAARVGVYRGEVAVVRPAQERTVPALRQLELADVRLAARPAPLRYVRSDAWDRDLLADAIAFDAEAGNLARGMDVEFGTDPMPARFYKRFTGAAAVRVLASAASVSQGRSFGPPSDVLLTFFVAEAAGGSGVDTIRRVAGLRSAGARWGLIAVDLDVPADDVVAAIDSLGNRALALGELGPAARSFDAGSSDGGGDQSGSLDGTDVAGTQTTTGTGETTDPSDGGEDPTDGGEDPPPPGDGKKPGGGGEDPPPPPPPPPPSEEPTIGEVVTGVVEDVSGEEDFGGGGDLPEELDAVGDIIDGDN